MNTNLRLAAAIAFGIALPACSQGFDYIHADGHQVSTTHGLSLSLDLPEYLAFLVETHFSEAYGGPAFNISAVVFTDDSTLVSLHAEEHADGSGGLDYAELPADSLAGISLNSGVDCFDLRSESAEDIDGNGFLSFLRDSGFSFDRAFVLKRFFLTNTDGTAEVVLSYGRELQACPDTGVAAELEQSISALAAATFSTLRRD